jgi:hypothetical protein
MLGAGLVAKKAVEKGLKVPEFVKTSLAPGSKVVIAAIAISPVFIVAVEPSAKLIFAFLSNSLLSSPCPCCYSTCW